MKRYTAITLCALLLLPFFYTQAAENPGMTVVPFPTPILVTDLTQQPESITSYPAAPDASPYAFAFFNVTYYAQMNPDLAVVSGGDEALLRTHWLSFGIHEGRRGSPAFDAKWYIANNTKAAADFGSDYAQAALYYRTIGVAQGQAGSADFSAADYAALYPSLAMLYAGDLRALAQHYNDHGWAQGLIAVIPGSLAGAAAAPPMQDDTGAAPLMTQAPATVSALADDGAPARLWPLDSGVLQALKVSDRHITEAAYYGPGKSYREAGTFKTAKMTRVKGAYIDGDYILVDIDYPGIGMRQVYFRKSAFKSVGNVPQRAFNGFAASLTADAAPRLGPGLTYVTLADEFLLSGTALSVFFEFSGWVYAEFMTAEGLVRGWVEAQSVKADGI